MKITIVGTGGVGGYFGGRLALAGNDVIFMARGAHLDSIKKNGLLIKSAYGEFRIKPANVTDNYDAVIGADMVMIATKAWQVKEVAKAIAPLISDNTIIYPIQNGVLAVDELSEFIPRNNIVAGLCRILSKIESPGVINHMGVDPTLIFSELDHQHTDRTAWMKYTFEMAGLKNIWSDDIQSELWKKFLLICSGGLLAITRVAYGALLSVPETRNLLIELFTEIYNVGIAAGINLPNNIVEKVMLTIDSYDADATTSMTRDIWEGKPSEIEYQNGSVVKLGQKYGIPTPINQFIYHSILPLEQKARQVN